MSTSSAQPSPFLTKRERAIFDLLCQKGSTNKEIAAELFISEATVKSHIQGIRQRLGADSNIRALLPLAFEYGRQVERTTQEAQQEKEQKHGAPETKGSTSTAAG